MNAETIQTIDRLLRDLAAQLGTTVENLWPIYVQHIYYIGLTTVVSSLVGFLLTGILSWMFFKRGYKLHKAMDRDYDIFLFAGALTLVFSIMLLFVSVNYFRYLIYPEGIALARLIEGL